MAFEFTNADVAQLLRIQGDVRETLQKYRLTTPAIVAAVACVRIAKALLDVYTEAERKEVVETVMVPFLLGETQQRTPSRRSGLILPSDLN